MAIPVVARQGSTVASFYRTVLLKDRVAKLDGDTYDVRHSVKDTRIVWPRRLAHICCRKPKNIVRLLVELLAPEEGVRICNPTCG